MKGSGVVRPWQCGFRDDYGLSGMVDPEAGIALMELYLQEGFLATELSLIFFWFDADFSNPCSSSKLD